MTALLEAPAVRTDLEFLTDDELFYAYAQGHVDRDAGFAELFARWDVPGRKFLNKQGVSDPEDRDDVMQIAYQQVHQFRDSFQTGIGAKSWFLTTVKNCARNFLKGKKRQCRAPSIGGKPISIEEETIVSGDKVLVHDLLIDKTMQEPVDQMIQSEEAAAVREATAQLPDHLREVIELRFFEDLSQDEIRERLGITRGTVKSRIGRALIQLRELMGDNDEE